MGSSGRVWHSARALSREKHLPDPPDEGLATPRRPCLPQPPPLSYCNCACVSLIAVNTSPAVPVLAVLVVAAVLVELVYWNVVDVTLEIANVPLNAAAGGEAGMPPVAGEMVTLVPVSLSVRVLEPMFVMAVTPLEDVALALPLAPETTHWLELLQVPLMAAARFVASVDAVEELTMHGAELQEVLQL